MPADTSIEASWRSRRSVSKGRSRDSPRAIWQPESGLTTSPEHTVPVGPSWLPGTASHRTNCSLSLRQLKQACQSGLSHLCAEVRGSRISCSVLCLRRSLFPELSRLWESCLVGAGELLLAGPQHTLWQERIWHNPLILRTIFLLSSVSGRSDVGHCPDVDGAGSELTLSTGSQTPGLGKGACSRELHTCQGCWGPHVPGNSIFLVDIPAPGRGVFRLYHGSQM